MCKFKGRHRIKQDTRAKMIKWGYKIWKLCDANTACVLDLDIYTGKNSEKSVPYKVVFHLVEGYLDKHHIVVMDKLLYWRSFILRSSYAVYLCLWYGSFRSKVFSRGVQARET